MKYLYFLSFLLLTSCAYLFNNPKVIKEGEEFVEAVIDSLDEDETLKISKVSKDF